jgi:hypothetical protein
MIERADCARITGLEVRKRRTKRATAVRRRPTPRGRRGSWKMGVGSWEGREE